MLLLQWKVYHFKLMSFVICISRYRARRSRSISRSPIGYRGRARGGGYSRSPIRSRSPPAERLRSHGTYRDAARSEKQRSISRSRSPSGSRSRSRSRSSPDTPSPKPANKEKSISRSPSSSPRDGKKGLVSYGEGSPDSAGQK